MQRWSVMACENQTGKQKGFRGFSPSGQCEHLLGRLKTNCF